MRHLFQSAAVCALAVASAAITSPAAAQSAGSTSPNGHRGDTDVNQTSELVVTARKTEEKLRDVPSTIQAVSAETLDATGPLIGTGDLVRTIPGVRFNNLEAPNLSEIAIRGSGTERATGADSAVGLFVNGAYAGSSTLGGRNFKNIDYFDISRIEVLEGPQGALYGRNSEYGTVNVILAKPSFTNSGYINDSYTAEQGRNQVMAAANFAVSDDVAVRFSGESVGQTKGFYYNPDQNTYYDHEDGWIARGQVRYKHGPLDVTLLADAQDMHLPVFVNVYDVAAGVLAALPKGYVGNRFVIPSNGLNDTEQKVKRVMINGTLDFGWSTLTNTTMVVSSDSLQHYGNPFDVAQEGIFQSMGESGAYPFAQVYTRSTDRTFYQDLHLDGKAMDGNLKWLAGAEFLLQHDSNSVQSATSPCALTATSGICTGTPTLPVCVKPLPTDANCPATFPLAFGTVSVTPQKYESEAVYGSLNYTIDRFTLDGELRYTNDDKHATQTVTRLYTGAQVSAPNAYKFSAGKLSYGVTLSYKLPGTWDNLIYVKTGSGYRSGGVNSGVANPNAPTPFQPVYNDEETTSYEVGFKGNVWSNIYVTVDAYTSRTNDAIANINDGCTLLNACGSAATQFNVNGGKVRAHGVEATLNAHFRVLEGRLDLTLTGANQHAKFHAVPTGNTGLPVAGSSVAQTPEWTSSVSVNYVRPIMTNVTGLLNVTLNQQSGGVQDTVTGIAPAIPLSNYTNLSLRTGARWKGVEVAFFAQNLANSDIQLLKFQQAGITYATRYNQPRTFGVNAIYRW